MLSLPAEICSHLCFKTEIVATEKKKAEPRYPTFLLIVLILHFSITEGVIKPRMRSVLRRGPRATSIPYKESDPAKLLPQRGTESEPQGRRRNLKAIKNKNPISFFQETGFKSYATGTPFCLEDSRHFCKI